MNGEDQQSSLLDYYLQRHTLRRDTTPRPKRTYRGIDLIGFDEIREEEEEKPEEEVGGLRGLLSGLGTGLLEPLGFIDPIGRQLHEWEDEARTGWGKAGHALGFMAGFAIPSTMALKVGALATKGLKIAETADAFVNLGAKGNLLRGAIAGGILGAGSEAEDNSERIKNIMGEAALFGIGDAAIHPIWKAISGASLIEKQATRAKEVLEEVAKNGAVNTEEGAVLLARAMRSVEERFPDELVAEKGIEKAKKELLYGINKLGLDKINDEEVRFVSSLYNEADDVKMVLSSLSDEIDFAVVKRQVGKHTYSDVLITRGELDKRIVSEYKRNLETYKRGFIKGQRVIHGSKERVVVGPTSKKSTTHIMLRTPGSGKKAYPAKLDQILFKPIAMWVKGPKTVRGANALYGKFVDKFGEFPEMGWDNAFEEFVSGRKLSMSQVQNLREYFVRRFKFAVEDQLEDGKDLTKVLKDLGKIENASPHPEGEFKHLASDAGYIVDKEVINGVDHTVLRNARGNAEKFETEDLARKWILEQEAPIATDLSPNSPFPLEAFPINGDAVQVANTGYSTAAIHVPFRIKALLVNKNLLPRMSVIRLMEDWAIQTMGPKNAPRFYALAERVRVAQDMVRKDADEWLIKGFRKADGTRVKSLQDILGVKLGKQRLSPAKGEGVVKLLETNPKEWPKVLRRHELGDNEVRIANEIREYLNAFWDEVLLPNDLIDVTVDDFLENYFPHILTKPDGRLYQAVQSTIGKRPSRKAINFAHELDRTGFSTRYLKDPGLVILNYTRSAFNKIHLSKPHQELTALVEGMPVEGPYGVLRQMLGDFLSMSYGGAPEVFWVVRAVAQDTVKKLGVELNPRDFDRFVQTLVSLNYGAFMGFRPALALRNLTQTLTVTLPYVGPKYWGKGVAFAMRGAESAKEALEEGAIRGGTHAMHLQDAIHWSRIHHSVKTAEGGKVAAATIKTLKAAQDLSAFSLSGGINTPFGKLPVGLYTRMDTVNRVISYGAQKKRVLDMSKKYADDIAKGVYGKFNESAGLTQLGEAHVREFHRILKTEGMERAARWSGRQMANETQWIYQLGAGPALFSHGVGRLFGMYGTWPSWYAQHLMRGVRYGTARDKARFYGWTMAVHGAFYTSAATIGINLARWSPLNSIGWAGGPFFDWFKQITDIISGYGESGGSPRRQLGLYPLGLKDADKKLPLPFGLGHFDPRKGYGLDFLSEPGDPFKGQKRLVGTVLSLFTPGMLQFRDMARAAQEHGTTLGLPNKVWRFTGFKPVAGQDWPGSYLDIK